MVIDEVARLKFYVDERINLDKLGFTPSCCTMDKTHAILISKKLSRHFKFKCPEIKFSNMRASDSGCAYEDKYIRLNNEPSYGVVIHELAHIYNYQMYGNYNHAKKLMRTIKRFAKYVISKNYWVKMNECVSQI